MTCGLFKNRPKWQALVFFVLTLVLVGCVSTSRTPPQRSGAAEKSPSLNRFPLRIALYMDEEFRQYTYRERNFYVPLGEWLSQKLPASLEPLFVEIRVITDQPQLDAEAGKYQAVLRPRIRFASYHPLFRKRRTLLEPEGRVRLYTEWTFSDPSGRKIWIQEIVGKGEGDDRTLSRLEAAVEAAMDDLFKKLQVGLTTSTHVHSYAYGRP